MEWKCEICNKEYKTRQALNSHKGYHNKPNRKSNFIEYNKKVKNGEVIKKFTNKYMKYRELGLPVPIMSQETRMKISKRTTDRLFEYWKNPENKIKQSESMKKAVLKNPDSYTTKNVSGRVKSFDFKDSFGNDIKIKGKWELKVAEFLNKKKVRWINKTDPSPYFWNESWHLYFPDFYLIDYNIYLEVKGFERERDRKKWNDFKNKLIILKKKEIENLEKWWINL
jgi:hypothetical protein